MNTKKIKKRWKKFEKKITEIQNQIEPIKKEAEEYRKKEDELLCKLDSFYSKIANLERAIEVIETVESYRDFIVTHISFEEVKDFLFTKQNLVFCYNENGEYSRLTTENCTKTSKVLDMRQIYEICFETNLNEEERMLKIVEQFNDFTN